jgi:hypothetical protein
MLLLYMILTYIVLQLTMTFSSVQLWENKIENSQCHTNDHLQILLGDSDGHTTDEPLWLELDGHEKIEVHYEVNTFN